MKLGLVSALGILASFGFQIVTARFLGPAQFGVLSSFFAIVSMAAIASGSLQNAVAVQTARALAAPETISRRSRFDGFTGEALILGGAGALIVVGGSPIIDSALHTMFLVPLLAAVAIILSFVFSRMVGTLQGTGDSRGVVWWSTIALLVRLALVFLALIVGLGLSGALAAVLIATALVMVGATIHAERLHVRVVHRVFQIDGIIVILMSMAFAWLTNVDVILVRALASHHTAGLYAAAATLVKAAFLIPSTLSLYLLPRFVRQENNRAMTRLGVRLTLLVTAAGSLLMTVIFWLIGSWITGLLFGAAYHIDNGLLAGLSLAYLPWIVAQGLLIRMNAMSSKSALFVLLGVAVVEWFVASAALPNIPLFILILGSAGLVVLVAFFVINRIRSASSADDETAAGVESRSIE